MKKTSLIVLLGISGASFVCAAPAGSTTGAESIAAAQEEASATPAPDEKKVDDLIGSIADRIAHQKIDPLRKATQKLDKRVADVEGKLKDAVAQNKKAQEDEAVRVQELVKKNEALAQEAQLCKEGLEELNSTMAEDPARRKLILGGCAGAGAITALLFVLLL